MTMPSKKPTHRTLSLKLISLIFGAFFWYIFGNMHTTSSWITVPVYFYNIPAQTTIKAPETVSVNILGKRSEIRALNRDQIAIHIDAQKLTYGPNRLVCDQETMFLPETIKLVHYVPSNPIIELCKTEGHQDI